VSPRRRSSDAEDVFNKSRDEHYVNMHGNGRRGGTGLDKGTARDTGRSLASNLKRLVSKLAQKAGPFCGPFSTGYGPCRGHSPSPIGTDDTCPARCRRSCGFRRVRPSWGRADVVAG
jgi:hypothetical protein